MKQVTVSVVSHLQAELVRPLLGDLNRYCSASIEKVVLTCNRPEVLSTAQDDLDLSLELIHNPRPLGFGANHNQAFRHCDTEWFLVINPDVRLHDDVVSALLRRAAPRTGLLAPQEISPTGEPIDNLRGLITPWELIQRQVLKRSPAPPSHGGWVKGMFMLVRAEAYRQVRGFDERFFMYCEDFDLCARLMLGGWTVDHHPDIAVTHTWQRDSHGSTSHLRRHLTSLLQMWASPTYWQYCRWMARITPHDV